MPNLSNDPLAEHLRRYGTDGDDTGDDDNFGSDVGSAAGVGAAATTSTTTTTATTTVALPAERHDVDVASKQSFFSLIPAWLSPGGGNAGNNVLAEWWYRNSPVVVELIRKYGGILMAFLVPFTPGAARQAGYREASHGALRALDNLDTRLPGGGRGWSKRWLSRPRGHKESSSWDKFAIDGQVGGVGVATTAVVFAAVSWCSWRRSSPSWPVLFLELACGSTWAANYIAREDGRREAKLLEAHLLALEYSLVPFFRGVESCMRMIKCAQALSFGLRLSVPMPPVARMEGRLDGTMGGDDPGGAQVALGELRALLMDVLEGGVELTGAFGTTQYSSVTGENSNAPEVTASEGQVSDSRDNQSLRWLTCVTAENKQLSANLRCFVEDLATRIDQAVAKRERWGLWWESQLVGASKDVRDMAEYFDAASQRLQKTLGSGTPPFAPQGSTNPSDNGTAIAETLWDLRLRYEETVVRLYACQSSVSAILRDPTRGNEDEWHGVGRALTSAVGSAGAGEGEQELWRKAEQLVKSITKGDPEGVADLGSTLPTSPNHHAATGRRLEAGVGWVSLPTAEGDGAGVFEGGNGDDGAEQKQELQPDAGVTNVLVGVASPGRSRLKREDESASRAALGELKDYRSRSQLLGELGSVLRTRPVPPTCEKRLPLESQLALEEEEDRQLHDTQDSELSLASPAPEPSTSPMPVCENADSHDLLCELRAQLSLAANEEIFFSEQDQWEVESVVEHEDILVPCERNQPNEPADPHTFRGLEEQSS